MSHYSYLITSAIIQGIFVSFFIKTGIDASPSGILQQIIDVFEPLIPEQFEKQVDLIRFLVFAIFWIPIIVGIFKVGLMRGVIVFLGVFIVTVLLINYT